MKVRVGIIGTGSIAATHMRILAQEKEVLFSSVHDKVRERAENFARMTGAQIAESPEEVFERSDAVYITTPNTCHEELAVAALDRGIHVFSEKPMATSLAGARQVWEASRRSKAIYQLGHNRRFAGVYKYTRQLLSQGTLVPFSAHIKMNRGELKKPEWVSNTQLTGGFLYETPVHMLDMARWLFGDVESLICQARSNVYEELDDFSLILTFVGGCQATFATSAHASWLFPFERLEIFGGHCSIETQEMERVRFSSGIEQESVVYDFSQTPWESRWGYIEEDRLFIRAIVEGTPPVVTAEDGYKTIELVEGCYRSARRGEKVRFPLHL